MSFLLGVAGSIFHEWMKKQDKNKYICVFVCVCVLMKTELPSVFCSVGNGCGCLSQYYQAEYLCLGMNIRRERGGGRKGAL